MKTLNKWMIIFIAAGILSIILLIDNWRRTWETMSMELVETRVMFFVAALVFLVAALIMHIMKAAIAEERDKQR
ncbi:MAG: hypothetical protein E7463_06725 [Ruminococcaceae bacterium]|nr:hypothetical protein [Oscillospiraceae bacterium]